MSRTKLNRKQAAELRRNRRAVLNLETFFTREWTLDDWAKLPKFSEGWRAVPDKNMLTVRIRAIRFSDFTRRFYLQIPKPEVKRAWAQLRERARLIMEEAQRELTRQIVADERKFIKQPTAPKQRRRKE